MVLDCGQLHQAVGTILLVQVEHPEDQRESGEDTETDTEPPVNTYHIEDDEQQENGQQAPDKKVQVLCLQAVEFHVASDSLVDIVFHSLLYYRKKERRTVAAMMRKTQAPNQLPAVLPVSGSPLLNFEYTLMAPISPTIAPAAYINLVAGSK